MKDQQASECQPVKIGGIPIEDVIEPHPHNRRRPSVAAAFPEVAAQWYYPKNCGFGPEDFSYGSRVNAWWRCSNNQDHIWRAQMMTRCVTGNNCPFCFGTFLKVPVPAERSLAVCYPKLAKEFHPTKNKGLTALDILAGSKKSVWWLCPDNSKHSWQCSVKQRALEHTKCNVCYHEKWLDLRRHPNALALFDKKKNLGMKPYNLSVNTPIWWRCQNGPDHSWWGRFRKTLRCPFCAKRKLSVTNSLKALFPKLAAQVHPTRNGDLTGDTIRAYGKEKIWWRCPYNPAHVWQAQIDNRTRNGSGCPECWKIRQPGFLKKMNAARMDSKAIELEATTALPLLESHT